MKYLLYILMAVFVVSCNMGPRVIPESDLKPLISDLLMTDAILSLNDDHNKELMDSTDFYQPVFDKYGYTQKDLEYTIYQLAGRQSKPLANMFDEIFNDMQIVKNRVSSWYSQKERFDKLAISFFADTIVRKDTLVVGSTKKVKFVIENPIKGNYTFIFTYHGHKEYAIPLRQSVGILTFKDKSKEEICKRNWVSRSFAPNLIEFNIDVPDSVSYDSLIFKIEDPNLKDTKFKMSSDTSKSYKFRIYFQPSLGDARKSNFIRITGLGAPLRYRINDSTLYDRIYSQIQKEDSCAMGPYSRR